jgi:putative copper export protein
MLDVSWDTIRLFLHILGATVWVGGQLTLAGLVGTVRNIDPGAPRLVARQFNKIAWSGFVLLVVTGIWNVLVIDMKSATTAYQVTLGVKILVVTFSGVSAAVHSNTKNKAMLATFGAFGVLSALGAVFLGVMLAG